MPTFDASKIRNGSFTLRTADDFHEFDGIRKVCGSLTIDALDLDGLELPDLMEVCGPILVTSRTNFSGFVGFSGLRYIDLNQVRLIESDAAEDDVESDASGCREAYGITQVLFGLLCDLFPHLDRIESPRVESLRVTGDDELEAFSSLRKLRVRYLRLRGVSSLRPLAGYRHACEVQGLAVLGHDSKHTYGGYSGIVVDANPELVDLEGLENFTALWPGLVIFCDNPALVSLAGLPTWSHTASHRRCASSVKLVRNACLSDISALSGVCQIEHGLHIEDNPSLLALHGFEKLNVIGNNYDGHVLGPTVDSLILKNLPGLEQYANDEDVISWFPALRQIDAVLVVQTGTPHNVILALISKKGYLSDINLRFSGVTESDRSFDAYQHMTGWRGLGINVAILDNPELRSLRPFRALSHVSGHFTIARNPMLLSLTGLENLQSVGGTLSLFENNALISLSALRSLSTVDGLYIHNNPVLRSLKRVGFRCEVSKFIDICNNKCLETLTGFCSAPELNGDVIISSNDSLRDLEAMSNVRWIGGDLWISYNKSLSDIEALSMLREVEGNLSFESLAVLRDLTGLRRLQKVGLDIVLKRLNGLADLHGLKSLRRVELLHICGNANLRSLRGFESLRDVMGDGDEGECKIIENPQLHDFSALRSIRHLNAGIIVHNCAEPPSVEVTRYLNHISTYRALHTRRRVQDDGEDYQFFF